MQAWDHVYHHLPKWAMEILSNTNFFIISFYSCVFCWHNITRHWCYLLKCNSVKQSMPELNRAAQREINFHFAIHIFSFLFSTKLSYCAIFFQVRQQWQSPSDYTGKECCSCTWSYSRCSSFWQDEKWI